ncbi:MAG TPA: hypothetical protein VJ952_07555 [Opitutales bacterium]|nr:hypothetical protein [Opitutales bacterium]
MKPQIQIRKWAAIFASAGALALFAVVPQAHAQLKGQLDILDLSDNSGLNPNTGDPWKVGDTYHLAYVTTATRDANSTDIAVYNTFVNDDAATQDVTNQSGGSVNLGSVNWFAVASTGTTDAIDNAIITASVWDIYNTLNDGAASATDDGFLASDATDFWDFKFPPNTGNNSGNPIVDLNGGNNNVWTGTDAGGIANAALGEGTGSLRHWTGWWNWDDPFNTDANDTLRPMLAVSQELQVVPEASVALLVGLAGLALLRRRR